MKFVVILRFISIILISVALMMALISRNNFSKYKDVLIPKGIRRKIKIYIRKGKVYNTVRLEEVSEEFMYKMIRYSGAVIALMNVAFILVSYSLSSKYDTNAVRRPVTGDAPIKVEINTGDFRESDLLLEVYPKEYTEEEFSRLSDKAMIYISAVIMGENEDTGNVKNDLIFPEMDETKTLKIDYKPERMDIISTTGKVFREDLDRDIDIPINIKLTDGIHERNEMITVTVIKNNSEETKSGLLDKLVEAEKEDRSKEFFSIPESVDGKKISVNSGTYTRNLVLCQLIALLTAVVLIYRKIENLKEKGSKNELQLREDYYSFVSRLSLMLGSGMETKDAMIAASEGNKRLAEEVTFCINQISSGISEVKAYASMAKRISIPEYTRLLTLICQNVKHGSSRLLSLMDQEVKNAMNIKREHIRRDGEIASEKLLLPTGLLLLIVIGIIMIPALKGLI